MAIRREHLEGLMRRMASNETILRIIVTEELLDIIYNCLEADLVTEVEAIYMSVMKDEGKYVFADFRNALNEAIAKIKREELPERIQWRLRTCLEYLFPPPPPAK